jgi:predicted amidohydrolase YtcJ
MDTSATRRQLLLGAAATGGAAVLGGGAAQAAAGTGHHPVRAAVVVVNGRVFTGDERRGTLQAVAVAADGRILDVGTTAAVRRLAGRGTQVIDAAGGTIMSGIQDGHMHPLGAARLSMRPSLGNAQTTVAELQALLRGFLDATADQEPDGWLEVADWNPVGLLPAGTVATKAILDALPTRRPIYLQGSDFHNSLVNSRALALAGIDRGTPNPAGGEIVRDAGGEATGLLKDSAQGLVGAVVPEPTPEQLDAAYADMATYLLANGITSFLDAASGEGGLKTYTDLISRGVVRQRVTPALVVDTELATTPAQALEYLRDLRRRYAGPPALRMTTAKVFLDGVIEFPAQTAALLSPYLDADGRPTDDYGDLYVAGPAFGRLATALDRAGWQVHSHAIGDRAVRVALDGYETALRRNGRRGLRHTITHLELVHPDDLRRFARLDVVASMQLQWAIRNAFTLDSLQPYIGQRRFDRLYPSRSLARAGALLAGGSDWPVDRFRPFNQIASAVDRTDPDPAGDRRPLNAGESLTREQSLRMHTRGSAFQLHDARSGVVAPGRRADLIVLDRDVTRVSLGDLRDTVVQHTLVAGKVVYDAGSSSARAAAARTAASGAGAMAHRHEVCCGAS